MRDLIIVRGGGDIATGTIHKLYQCGFDVLVLETDHPCAVRRNVSFCEAVYDGRKTVEGVTCVLVKDAEEAAEIFKKNAEKPIEERCVVMLVDPACSCLQILHPLALVDCILFKRNVGTRIDMAPLTIALGPGFEAGVDVDLVVESMRGHQLGRIISHGCAIPNTHIPGMVGGYAAERVIHSPGCGEVKHVARITDIVRKGQLVAYVGDTPVYATLDGILRGFIREGYMAHDGMKIGDIDPRAGEYENCFTISDKARCIAGGVVEAIMHYQQEKSR